MKKVLNFHQFTLNESAEISDYIIPGINPYMTDGYEIIASDCTDCEQDDGKLSVKKDSGSSILLSFGNSECDVWLPKDSISVDKKEDNYIITIYPDCKWFNKQENRNIIEDFIESFDSHRINLSSREIKNSDSVRDDIETLMDILGIPMNIEGIEKISDNEYEISLNSGILILHKRRSPNDMIGFTKLYKDSNSDVAEIEICSIPGGINLVSKVPDVISKEIETSFDSIKNNPYHRYLLKRPIGLETNLDREELYNHYIDSINSSDKEKTKSDDANIADSGRSNIAYLKDLKKLISEYTSSEKIREISPDL